MSSTDAPDDDPVRVAAAEARRHAYVPYTGFDAGAAVLATDGSVHAGAVVENISLGLAMCAERVALFACAAAGARPSVLVLDAPSTDGGLTTPCGACLQVALELGGPDVTVIAVGDTEELEAPVHELLPRGPHRANTGV